MKVFLTMFSKKFHLLSKRIYGGGPVVDENPHGKLTQFNVWTRELSTKEMINFTLSCQNLVDKTGTSI